MILAGNNMLDQDVINLAKAIRQYETGNQPIGGQTGELKSRYQWLPSTWKTEAGRILGDSNAPLSLENENKVAYIRIKEWKDQGKNPGQIASLWNSGREDMYAMGVMGTGASSTNPNVRFDVPKYVKGVYGEYQKLKKPSQIEKEEIKTPAEIDILEKTAKIGLGGILSGVGKATELYERATNLPFVRLPFKAVGGVVGAAGGIIGGLTGGALEAGKQIYETTQGKPFDISQVGKTAIESAKETAKFGYGVGETGAKVAPLVLTGQIPTAIMGAAEIQKGAKLLEEDKGKAYTRAAGGLLGILGAPLVKGKFLDTGFLPGKFKITPKSIKAAKEAEDIFSQLTSSVPLSVRQRASAQGKNIPRVMAEEGIKLGDKKIGNTSVFDTGYNSVTHENVRAKMLEPSERLNDILKTDPIPRFNVNDLKQKIYSEIDAKNILPAEKIREKGIIDDLLAGVKENMNGSEYHLLKQQLWNLGYDAMNPLKNELAREIGHKVKIDIESAYPENAPIRALNETLGDYATILTWLEKMNEKAIPQGGKLTKKLNQITGAIIGSKISGGSALGYWAGGKITDYLSNPQRLTEKAFRSFQKSSEIPKSIKTLEQAKQFLIEQIARPKERFKLLPAPSREAEEAAKVIRLSEKVQRLAVAESGIVKPKLTPFGNIIKPTQKEITASKKAAGIYKPPQFWFGKKPPKEALGLIPMGFGAYLRDKLLDKNTQIQEYKLGKTERSKVFDNLKTEDLQKVLATIYAEAGGESPTNTRAILDIMVNRSVGKKRSIIDTISIPGQFDGYNNSVYKDILKRMDEGTLKPSEKAKLKEIADMIVRAKNKGWPDSTSGVDHYYNPDKSDPLWKNKGEDKGRRGRHLLRKLGNYK